MQGDRGSASSDTRATKRNLPRIVDAQAAPRAATDTIPQARYARGEYSITLYKGDNDKLASPALAGPTLPIPAAAKRTAAGSQSGLRRPISEAPAIPASIRITSINTRQVKLTINDQPMVLAADDALALANRIIAVLGK